MSKTIIKTILATLLVFLYITTAAQTQKSTFNFLHTCYSRNGDILKTDKKTYRLLKY